MATHRSVLAWRIPRGQRSMSGYSPWGHKESKSKGYSPWGHKESKSKGYSPWGHMTKEAKHAHNIMYITYFLKKKASKYMCVY